MLLPIAWNKPDPDSPEGVFRNSSLNFIRPATIKPTVLMAALVVYQINPNTELWINDKNHLIFQKFLRTEINFEIFVE